MQAYQSLHLPWCWEALHNLQLIVLFQVAHLGMQLLEAKQVSGLLPVLRFAGTVSEEPHLQFLKVSLTA